MKNFWTVLLVCALAIVSIDADAARLGGGKSFGRQSSNVTQRQATPPAAPADAGRAGPERATTPRAKPARCRRLPRRGAQAPVGRHARRPGRRPGPGLARAFARPRRRLRQHPADRSAGAGCRGGVAHLLGAFARARRAARRRLCLPGRGQPGRCDRAGAVQPRQCRQRRLGASVGTQPRGLRRRAGAADHPAGTAGRRWPAPPPRAAA